MADTYPGQILWALSAFVDDPAVVQLEADGQPGHVRLTAKQPKGYGGGESTWVLLPEQVVPLIAALQATQDPGQCPATADDPEKPAGALRCEYAAGHSGEHFAWPVRWGWVDRG